MPAASRGQLKRLQMTKTSGSQSQGFMSGCCLARISLHLLFFCFSVYQSQVFSFYRISYESVAGCFLPVGIVSGFFVQSNFERVGRRVIFLRVGKPVSGVFI